MYFDLLSLKYESMHEELHPVHSNRCISKIYNSGSFIEAGHVLLYWFKKKSDAISMDFICHVFQAIVSVASKLPSNFLAYTQK